MDSSVDTHKLYPDEISLGLLNETEFLCAVEKIISIATSEGMEDSTRNLAVMFHLGVLCYTQGVQLAVENLKQEGRINDQTISHIDRQVMAILCAQTRWEFAEMYCKSMLNFQLNPIGLLIVLKHIASSNTSASDAELSAAVDQASSIIERKAKGELASITMDPSAPVEASVNLDSELIPVFFELLEKIGTFYMDRDKYETDEQKALHDQIIAVYKKISE